ncbi:hypothetical protein [Aeromicrobium yanjiei]|uniref:Uncharacterized protein n=1 Tax=Aeromicrobium yanjiei TaxID=2662028 RepID=A0A5Q2ML37_9ACTN|nr:hypothetical protein [Aeromicrobium yanjiei]QGG41772.1 hypothetical protein GEV26_10585 [Aeromicrobium yanjiei]
MTENKGTCFIAMPITTHKEEAARYGGDTEHWNHVMEHLFVPAIEAAGYEAIRPVTSGSSMIHAEIVKHLSESTMVLCDLSGHNPNVFFELGVRTSLDLPVALVKDNLTSIPFDLGGMNTHSYGSSINVWSNESDVDQLATHITRCVETCNDKNPLWQRFGLSIKAEEPTANGSPHDAKMDLLLDRMDHLDRRIAQRGDSVFYRDRDDEDLAATRQQAWETVASEVSEMSHLRGRSRDDEIVEQVFINDLTDYLVERLPGFLPRFHIGDGVVQVLDPGNDIPPTIRTVLKNRGHRNGIRVGFASV